MPAAEIVGLFNHVVGQPCGAAVHRADRLADPRGAAGTHHQLDGMLVSGAPR